MMFHLVKQQHQGKELYDEVLGPVVPFSLAIFFSVTVIYPYNFCEATVHSCIRITILIYHSYTGTISPVLVFFFGVPKCNCCL
jgi:hypothetical protein